MLPRASCRRCSASAILSPRLTPTLRAAGRQLAALGPADNAAASAKCQRVNGHGGLAAAAGDQAAAVAKKKIRHVMGSMAGIDHRGLRIVPHAAGAEQVDAELLFLGWPAPDLAGAGSLQQLDATLPEKLRGLEIFRMVLIGDAHGG